MDGSPAFCHGQHTRRPQGSEASAALQPPLSHPPTIGITFRSNHHLTSPPICTKIQDVFFISRRTTTTMTALQEEERKGGDWDPNEMFYIGKLAAVSTETEGLLFAGGKATLLDRA